MSTCIPHRCGILVVGHGTRDPRGTAEFLALAAELPAIWPEIAIIPCFLELQQPDIATGIRELLAKGVQEIVVAPLLLFAAGHAKHDIPASVTAGLSDFPHVRTVQAEPLDCHPEVLKLADFQLQTAVDLQPGDRIIIVARGTSDPEGIAAIERFVAARRQQLPQNPVEVAYMAAAEPRLRQRVLELAQNPQERLVLQPHLLFEGEVIRTVREIAAEFGHHFPNSRIPVAEHLGAGILSRGSQSDRLITAFTDRISAAAGRMQ